jgi:hypothetical protein
LCSIFLFCGNDIMSRIFLEKCNLWTVAKLFLECVEYKTLSFGGVEYISMCIKNIFYTLFASYFLTCRKKSFCHLSLLNISFFLSQFPFFLPSFYLIQICSSFTFKLRSRYLEESHITWRVHEIPFFSSAH